MEERRLTQQICRGYLQYRHSVCIFKWPISDKRTNEKAYSEVSEEQALELPTLNELTADSTSKRYTLKTERELNVPGLMLIELNNDRFATAVKYRSLHVLNVSYGYEEDVAHEFHRMAKRIAVQMTDRTFSEQELRSVITFLQKFKSPCNEWRIHKDAAMGLLKQYISDTA